MSHYSSSITQPVVSKNLNISDLASKYASELRFKQPVPNAFMSINSGGDYVDKSAFKDTKFLMRDMTKKQPKIVNQRQRDKNMALDLKKLLLQNQTRNEENGVTQLNSSEGNPTF